MCVFFNLACNLTTASDKNSKNFYKYKITEQNFNFGDREEFEFSKFSFQTNGKGRFLATYQKKRRKDGEVLGRFLRFSEDDGETFGKELEIAEIFRSQKDIIWGVSFLPNGYAALGYSDGNLFYSQSDGTLQDWGLPVQVNDEQGSVKQNVKLVQKSPDQIYLVWVDKRRGIDLIFFSSSRDGGKTWSPNRLVDYDFREGSQNYPQFIAGENGRLLVFWEDWRGSKNFG